MIAILIASFLSSCIFLVFGNYFCKYCFNNIDYKKTEYSENSLFGIIIFGFFTLLINFFLPLNKIFGTLTILISVVLILKFFLDEKEKKKLLTFLLTTSIITFFLILLSNINRPDAGLYHLPFISMLNDSKIIIGSANIHFRFGHTSILQYISAGFNNYFFSNSIINIPIATILSIFIYYLIEKIFLLLNKNQKNISFIIFLILIFSLYAFNRYSNFGNDVPAHIYFFILVTFYLQIDNVRSLTINEFYKINYLSIFLFAIKPFMVFVFIIPLIDFIFSKKRLFLLKNKNFFICLIFFLALCLKNVLISGCIVYPSKVSCLSNLKIFDADSTKVSQELGEAWAKGLIDQTDGKALSVEEFNKGFNWLNTWVSGHLNKIIEKLLPYFIFLILLLIFLITKSFFLKKKINYVGNKELNIRILFIFSLTATFIWFLNFPVYRYGLAFFVTSFILCYCIFFNKIINSFSASFYKKTFTTMIIIGIFAFISKNFIRIYKNINIDYVDYPWPKIYSINDEIKNIPQKFRAIKKDGEIIYFYSADKLCMYSLSPCSYYFVNDLILKEKYGYKIYFKSKKLNH